MQGQLRGEHLQAVIETECAHCHQPFHVELDSDLNYRVIEHGAAPVIFVPQNAIKESEPSIVDTF